MRAIFSFGLLFAIAFAVVSCGGGDDSPATPFETYYLVHAIGNEERVNASGLSKAQCETEKAQLKEVATALGAYNEATGYGSITCLPSSMWSPG